MREYLLSVCATAAAASLICLIAPKDRRGVNFIAGLCVALALILPLGGLVRELDLPALDAEYGAGDFRSQFYDGLDGISRENVQISVGRILENDFGILPGNYTVCADVAREGDTVTLGKITVVLTGRAIWSDPHGIAEYIESVFGCKCEIAVG